MIARPRGLLVALPFILLLAGGCGAAKTTTTVQSAITTQATTPNATVPQTGQTQTTPPATGSSTPTEGIPIGSVPNEVGVRLDAAERSLQSKRIPFKAIAKGTAGTPVKSNWMVCESSPAPRTHLETGTTVDLIVAPSCR
jgi:hypothetical protein